MVRLGLTPQYMPRQPARRTYQVCRQLIYASVLKTFFYDEDVAFASRLNAAGVPCELAVFPGLYHAADTFLFDAKISQRLHHSMMSALRDAIS